MGSTDGFYIAVSTKIPFPAWNGALEIQALAQLAYRFVYFEIVLTANLFNELAISCAPFFKRQSFISCEVYAGQFNKVACLFAKARRFFSKNESRNEEPLMAMP